MQASHMEEIKALLMAGKILEAGSLALSLGVSPSYDRVEHARQMAERENTMPGNLTGYDCGACLNRGYSTIADDDGHLYCYECACMPIRHSLRNIEKSGLAGVIDLWTFDAFQTSESWQIAIKSGAQEFVQAVKDGSDAWFLVSGQPGCGKSHICTAVSGELLRSGRTLKYMVWTEEAPRIKAARNDEEIMVELLEPLKTVDVLYIDDLFKMAQCDSPTAADIRLAFEIINARYVRGKTTIISCEMPLDPGLLELDGATFSRVYQRTRAPVFALHVGMDVKRNYRLWGGLAG